MENVILSKEQINSELSKTKNKSVPQNSDIQKLYTKHSSEIYAYILSFFPRDRFTADDIIQEVFLKALAHLHTLRDSGKARAWLYRIAANKCIDYLRRQKTARRQSENTAVFGQSTRSIEEDTQQKELECIVNNAVLSLPDFLRTVFMLREYQNLEYSEIAVMTDTSLSRVKKAMIRAVRQLSHNLKNNNIGREILK